MNIFALSDNPIDAARWQHDRHVNKMTVESAQLLSMACLEDSFYMNLMADHHKPLLYAACHENNPLTNWTKRSPNNFTWLVIHASALVAEKHRRWPNNGMHKTYPLIAGFQAAVCRMLGVDRFYTRNESRELIVDPAIVEYATLHTPFYQAMPDEYKDSDAITAYRDFYLGEKIFQDHVKWTNCDSLTPFLADYEGTINPDWSAQKQGKTAHRLIDLLHAHEAGLVAARMPRDPHPDLLKPVNPKAIKRFGTK